MEQVLLRFGDVDITLCFVILFCVLAALIIIFIFVAVRAYKAYLRNRFYRDYRVILHNSIDINRRKPIGPNSFQLMFPTWSYANKDGSRDRRRNANPIRFGQCILDVDSYRIVCDSPTHMVWLVNMLRAKGVSIDKCREEEIKFARVAKWSCLTQEQTSIASIRNRFRGRERDFESYCAGLFRASGLNATVTPGSGDGGLDIELRDESGLAGIVECKCWDANHKVGRPEIQKLIGANAAYRAPRMIFITTSDFSTEAVGFARAAGVELINGRALLRMTQDACMASASAPSLGESEWMLDWSDLASYYPPDFPPEEIGL